MAAQMPNVASVRKQASQADAALLAERRRQAALRVVREGDPSSSTHQDPVPDEVPLFEATTSAIGGDVDAAGNRLVVWPDRVELRDGKDRVRAVIGVAAIAQVTVRRRLTSATLTVSGTGGESMVLKGVKPSSAARFRHTVAALKLPADGEASSTPTSEALRRLDELAAMGLLTDEEVANKRSLLAQRSLQRRG
jgi:hypothetical protein